MARLNKVELALVNEIIRGAKDRNGYAWNELKQQIDSWGLRDWYPAQEHFDGAIKLAMASLDHGNKSLLQLMGSARKLTPDEAVKFYREVAAERIVTRAAEAARRQIHPFD